MKKCSGRQEESQASKHRKLGGGRQSGQLATPIKPCDRHRADTTRPAISGKGATVRNMIGFVRDPTSRVYKACAVLLLAYLVTCTSGEYEAGEAVSGGSSHERTAGNEYRVCSAGKCLKRNTQEISSGMWFGPRLGRRRRSDDRPEVDSEIEAIANIIDGARWALITVPGDKRQSTQFTPRLGRDSGEDYLSLAGAKDPDDGQDDDQGLQPLFSPRINRRVPWTPSPRLGRQLRAILRKI